MFSFLIPLQKPLSLRFFATARASALSMSSRTALLTFMFVLLLGACNRNEPTPTATSVANDTSPGLATLVAPNATTTAAPAADAATPTAAVPAAPTPTPLSGSIVIWHSWAQAEGNALAAILTQLQQAYPGVQVETLFVAPNDLVASYAEAVAAGGGPDLVLAPNWWLGDLVAASAVQNLDSLVGGNLDAAYWPASVAAMRHSGSLYGFPLTSSLVALYVNTSLVSVEDVPGDTATLLSVAAADPTAGIGLYATLFHAYWGFPAYGATLIDAQGAVTLDQFDGSAAYLTWLNTLNSTPGSYVNSDYGMLLDRFKKGEFAYFVDGPWAISELRTVFGDNLAVLPLPDGPAGDAQPWLYSDGLYLNPNLTSEQQMLALNIALYFSSDEAGTILASTGGLLPAARNADLSATPLLQGFATQAAAAQAMPTIPAMENVWAYGTDMLIKALTDVADPATIVIETTTLINEANGRSP